MHSESFWHTLATPIMMLAPMEDVTDTAFRELVMRNASPGNLHVVFTEFTSTDGMCHPVGRDKVSYRLKITESERKLLRDQNIKIVAQIWGNKPEKFFQTVEHISKLGLFDGIDINMGCPVKNVVAHGSCSALIDQEPLAAEIIAASNEATDLPLSVKTRLGLKKIDTERWMRFLLQQPLDAIILHGRIQKQMSEGAANWDEIEKAVQLRNEISPSIKIIGNGDITTLQEARQKCLNHGVDGVMIGRGIFNNPWLFAFEKPLPDKEERISTLLMHLQLFENAWGDSRHFPILRRFFKIYLSGFRGAVELRQQMMQVESFNEAREVVNNFSFSYLDTFQ
jgi:nifR3 family TIM-barrel protein